MQEKEITFLKEHKVHFPHCKMKAMIVHSIFITCSLLDQFGKGRKRMNKLWLICTCSNGFGVRKSEE